MSSTCVIEINDAGITAANAQGLQLTSPGYAVADGNALFVGEAAYVRARLNPRRSYDRFWSQLNQQPLHRPAGDAHSHADLAYFHLREIWQTLGGDVDEVIFAVPADFGSAQLALLLGIAQTLEIPVGGLLASPVAAAAAVAGDGPRLLLDAELHRLTATRVAGGKTLELGASRELLKQGISGLWDAWVSMLAERFVQETRYDPLHQAAAEQMLYTRLREWLPKLPAQGSARFELQVGQRSHTIDVSTSELMQTAAGFYRPLVDAAVEVPDTAVLLSHRVAALPGLLAVLAERLPAPAIALSPAAVAETVLEHLEVIRSDPAAPAFVTRLPGAVSSAVPAPTAAPSGADPVPTHLLCQWRAYPINAAPMVLDASAPRALQLGESPAGASVSAHAGRVVLKPGKNADVTLNGRRLAADSPLAIGDQIALEGGQEMRLITLVSDDETA